jgi:predicted nucleic acid-binding protein
MGTVKYLFDTDVISALMKGKGPDGLRRRLSQVASESQAISAITVFEVYHGAYKSPNPDKFIMLFETTVLPAVEVIAFDDNAARIAGRVLSERERQGKPMAPMDLQIAATALASGRILITGNVKIFSDIPALDIQNWLE